MFITNSGTKSPFSHTDIDRFWSTDPLTGTHYQINHQSALTWHQARKSCQQQNAELLSVTEIHEQIYLRGELISKIQKKLFRKVF